MVHFDENWDSHFGATSYCIDTVDIDTGMINKYAKYQEARERKKTEHQRCVTVSTAPSMKAHHQPIFGDIRNVSLPPLPSDNLIEFCLGQLITQKRL